MKFPLLLLPLLLLVVPLFAQDVLVPEPTQSTNVPYRLFRTRNIYTFLKLDTRTGRIWQVQWGTDKDHEFSASGVTQNRP